MDNYVGNPSDTAESMKHGAPTTSKASAKSFGSSLSRRLSSLSFVSRKSTTRAEKPKNDFGLNTVYEPENSTPVVVDFVFVHGLGGGSSTTWCLKQNAEYFWPKEWLPKDPDFTGVRIHSFGYNANWATWLNSPVDVHAFGQSLVEELRSDPKIHNQDTRIVLVGHSMGGLVIKKACILSKTNPDYADISRRLHSLYFLGTPHRGSNLAGVLNNLLRVSGSGRRAYVSGLESKSEMIRVLSDSFRIHYAGIHLHTFYESQPTPPVGMIVDVESATLGYAEERLQLLNANHRDLAKFESPSDSNYRSLRNRLASTVQQIRQEIQESQISLPPPDLTLSELPNLLNLPNLPDLYQSTANEMEEIARYLSVDQSAEDNLSSLNDTRLNGSCSWLTAKPSFQEWWSSLAPRYFWLKGAPASGKSVLASYIIEYLKENPTCYYFFRKGDKTGNNLSSFLRSMAFQMAQTNPAIRSALFQLSQQGPPIDIRNQRSIWNKVYTSCVFHITLNKPHYWVVDALDEAAEKGPLDEYFLLLSKIDNNIPLKVFITSQPSHALDHMFVQLPLIAELITPDDLLVDIRLYVQKWSANLPVNTTSERDSLVEKIVNMSGGSFLWTALVTKQLREVFTVEEVHEVLCEIPQKMSELYKHNITRMESSRSKSAAKHVITWAICSVYPLTVAQMKDAIKLSLGITLARDLKTSLQYLCGQFLDIDKQSRIQVVHETARTFLTSPDLDSEFRIDYPEGHHLIAMACLNHLISDELKYSKRRRSSTASGPGKTSMTDYACLRFSEHVLRASSSSNELFDALEEFFNTNVLSWIEHVAQLKDLDCLNRTSRHLSSYLSRRMKYVPLLQSDLHVWAVDLPRLVTQFGVNLLAKPVAIHTLVPPFCPRDSAVYRKFGYAEDGIKLIGSCNAGWGDRICSISYHDTYVTVVASQEERFALSLADGSIKIYRISTCEELLTLQHEEPISVLEFSSTSKLIASAGLRHLRLWDTTSGTQLFHVGTDSQTLTLGFDETETRVTIATKDKLVTVYQAVDGSQLYKLPWTDAFSEDTDTGFAPSPAAAKISIEQQTLAIIYRSKPVQLWSLDNQHLIGACIRPTTHKHDKGGHIVNCVAFNTSSASPRLLVSYWDDMLVAFDSITCKPLAYTLSSVTKIAVAINGKTFIGSDGNGDIKIFDFETLQLLHSIQVQGDPVSSLTLTSNSLRIIDSRGTQANVWEPLVLFSQDSESHSSEPSGSVDQIVDDFVESVVDQSTTITSLHCCEQSDMAFCGRNDGRVDICNLDDPEKTMRNLYRHRGTFTSVICIDWSPKARITASADSAGNFRVMQITTGSRREWGADLLIEARLGQGCIISQILVHPNGSLVLVSSSESDSVWSVSDKKRVGVLKGRKRTAWKWFVRPFAPSQLLLFEDKVLRLFKWEDLSPIAASEDPVLPIKAEERTLEDQADTDAISISSEGDDLVLTQRLQSVQQKIQVIPSQYATRTKVHVFDLTTLDPGSSSTPKLSFNTVSQPPFFLKSESSPYLTSPFLSTAASNPLPESSSIAKSRTASSQWSTLRRVADIPDVESMIGTVKRFDWWHLVFLSKSGWVCSVEICGGGRKVLHTFQRHFFVPSVWRTGNSPLISKVRRNHDIVFVHQSGVIIVKNGLDNGEHVPFFQDSL